MQQHVTRAWAPKHVMRVEIYPEKKWGLFVNCLHRDQREKLERHDRNDKHFAYKHDSEVYPIWKHRYVFSISWIYQLEISCQTIVLWTMTSEPLASLFVCAISLWCPYNNVFLAINDFLGVWSWTRANKRHNRTPGAEPLPWLGLMIKIWDKSRSKRSWKHLSRNRNVLK